MAMVKYRTSVMRKLLVFTAIMLGTALALAFSGTSFAVLGTVGARTRSVAVVTHARLGERSEFAGPVQHGRVSSQFSASGFVAFFSIAAAVAAAGGSVSRRRGCRNTALLRRSVSVVERAGVKSEIRRELEVQVPAFLGANPAASSLPGTSPYVTEYTDLYDLSDPKGSFERVGKRIVQELKEELPHLYEMPAKEVNWVSQSLDYNTQGGKMNRGLIVVETGVELLKNQGKVPTNTDLNRFAVLGWAVELLQACFLMADDMIDGSLTRRGSPCWYRLPDVGLLATNDFLMIEMFVYKVLKRHFGTEDYFVWLVDLFLESTFQTECGQLLDSICANCELEELTSERWTLLVKYKTAFYSFYLPVALPMLVTGMRDKTAFDAAREMLVLMGIYFQAQDDYLDAFACPEQLGKVGTDIQDKKCSWLFAQAYHEYNTPEAKAYLDQHYGKCKVGSEEEKKIKDIYRSLGLQEVFRKYEADVADKLSQYRPTIEDVGLPWTIFKRFFDLIHQRDK